MSNFKEPWAVSFMFLISIHPEFWFLHCTKPVYTPLLICSVPIASFWVCRHTCRHTCWHACLHACPAVHQTPTKLLVPKVLRREICTAKSLTIQRPRAHIRSVEYVPIQTCPFNNSYTVFPRCTFPTHTCTAPQKARQTVSPYALS